jgi:selenide,water dikinase
LAVNGIVPIENIKQNNQAKAGDVLFLTKPLGVGILTTAEKKAILKPEHKELASNQMMRLNKVGEELGKLTCVSAMTDVTGFGLLGHLTEMAEGSGLSAIIDFDKILVITPEIYDYTALGSIPGGTNRNMDSYGHKIAAMTVQQRAILADPQTSGGLLIAVARDQASEVIKVLSESGLADFCEPIGYLTESAEFVVRFT